MARGRMISKSLSTSEKYAALVNSAGDLTEFCHALYPLIVSHADDFGRLQGDPFTVKHACYPASCRGLDEFAVGLARLQDVDLINWYVVEGKKYIQIVKFEKHQIGLHKRTKSAFPRVPGTSGNYQEMSGQENLTELNLRELNGTKENERTAAAPPASPVSENLKVITKIAHEAIDIEGVNASLATLAAAVKSLCAIRAIQYEVAVVRKAVDSALAQRKARAS